MAGEIFREAMEILEPLLPASAAGGVDAAGGAPAVAGSVLVCTVRGDIHDIGKSILVTLLRSHGFAVHDLGVDVPPAEVARRALELQPDVVGLSGLLTAAHPSMKETVTELRRVAPQLGHPSVIIIGGGAVDAQVCDWAGADLWAPDAVRGVELIRAHTKR
jgi:5-methyltetrahydrofolate--homocysteine methyltransferase